MQKTNYVFFDRIFKKCAFFIIVIQSFCRVHQIKDIFQPSIDKLFNSLKIATILPFET